MMEEKSEIKDAILYTLISLVNNEEYGVELGVTVSVKGTVISGLLVGYDKYLKGIEETFNIPGNEAAQSIGKVFGLLSEQLHEDTDEQENEEDKSEPQFIHLKDAIIFNSNLPINSQGVWWRGKLSSIDGFSFGNFESN